MTDAKTHIESFLNTPIIKDIARALQDSEHKAFFIGGVVRDLLLKREVKDLDVVTLSDSGVLAKEIAHKFGVKKVSIFKNFGTAMLKYKDYELEFVQARKESYSESSRNPEVEKGTLKEDQLRRDFTINALSISLNKDDFGELIDPFNGIDDLEHKIIKTPIDADQTYFDDPLRMLRAIRFASQLNFQIEQQSFKAIEKNKNRIHIISQERITDELNKIILSDKPSIGFILLEKCGLLQEIFPLFCKLKGTETIDGKSHKDNFHHTLEVLDNLAKESKNLWLRWAALLHDIAKPKTKRFHKEHGFTFHGHEDLGAKMVPQIFKRLKLPLDQKMKYVQKLVRLHLRPIALSKENITDSALRRLLFEASDDIDDLMLLCMSDITSKNVNKVKRFKQNLTVVSEKLKNLEERDKIKNWQPPIKGDEIIKLLHIQPSKTVGIIKEAIKEAILDGIIENDKEQAIDFMYKKAKELL